MGHKAFLGFLSQTLSEQDAGRLLDTAAVVYTIGTGEYARIQGKFVSASGDIHSPSGVPRITKVRILDNEEKGVWGKAEPRIVSAPTGSVPHVNTRVQHPLDADHGNTVSASAVKNTGDGSFHEPHQNANIAAKMGGHGQQKGGNLHLGREARHGTETTPSGLSSIHMTSAKEQPAAEPAKAAEPDKKA